MLRSRNIDEPAAALCGEQCDRDRRGRGQHGGQQPRSARWPGSRPAAWCWRAAWCAASGSASRPACRAAHRGRARPARPSPSVAGTSHGPRRLRTGGREACGPVRLTRPRPLDEPLAQQHDDRPARRAAATARRPRTWSTCSSVKISVVNVWKLRISNAPNSASSASMTTRQPPSSAGPDLRQHDAAERGPRAEPERARGLLQRGIGAPQRRGNRQVDQRVQVQRHHDGRGLQADERRETASARRSRRRSRARTPAARPARPRSACRATRSARRTTPRPCR